MKAILFYCLIWASFTDAIRLETIVTTLQVHFKVIDLKDFYVTGDPCATFGKLSDATYNAFYKAILHCKKAVTYTSTETEMIETILVYIRQTHVRSTTLDTWTRHLQDFLIPYLNSNINGSSLSAFEPSSFITIQSIELRAVESLELRGYVAFGDGSTETAQRALHTQLGIAFSQANYTPFLIDFKSLETGAISSWSTLPMFADYAQMVDVDVDLCSPIMLDKMTGIINRYLEDNVELGIQKPITVGHFTMNELRPNLLPLTVCEQEKVEEISLVYPGFCVSQEDTEEPLKLDAQLIQRTLENQPLRQIRLIERDKSGKGYFALYLNPTTFLQANSSMGLASHKNWKFKTFILHPSDSSSLMNCHIDDSYLQAHGICPGDEGVFEHKFSKAVRSGTVNTFLSVSLVLLTISFWR